VQKDCTVLGNTKIDQQSNAHLIKTRAIGHYLGHMNHLIDFSRTICMNNPTIILSILRIHISTLLNLVIFSEALKNLSTITPF